MPFYNDIPFLKKMARFSPYVFIVVGALIALLGGYIKIILGVIFAASGKYFSDFVQSRITHLETEKEEAWKNTPPQLDVFLARLEGKSDFVLVIDFENKVPINASWHLTTRGDVIASPFFMGHEEIHPKDETNRLQYKQVINVDRIVDGYLKLNFRYFSIHYKELGSPNTLIGEISREYRFRDGALFHWNETSKECIHE